MPRECHRALNSERECHSQHRASEDEPSSWFDAGEKCEHGAEPEYGGHLIRTEAPAGDLIRIEREAESRRRNGVVGGYGYDCG